MFVIRTLAASAAALIATAGIAAAADLGGYVPPPEAPIYTPTPAFSWTGPYLGLQGGYGWGSSTLDDTPSNTLSVNGWQGGAYGGYNFQFQNNLVLGLEGDVHLSGKSGSNAGETVSNPWNGSVRARVGYAVDRFMVYGTGGLAFGQIKATDGVNTESATKAGWTAGLGVETAITQNVTAKLEYRHTNLGSASFGAPFGNTSYTSNDVMVGVGFRF